MKQRLRENEPEAEEVTGTLVEGARPGREGGASFRKEGHCFSI